MLVPPLPFHAHPLLLDDSLTMLVFDVPRQVVQPRKPVFRSLCGIFAIEMQTEMPLRVLVVCPLMSPQVFSVTETFGAPRTCWYAAGVLLGMLCSFMPAAWG